MHLSGETDGSNLGGLGVVSRHDLLDSFAGSAPPVVGILFGPTGFRRRERHMLGGPGGYDCPFGIDENRAGTACTYTQFANNLDGIDASSNPKSG